MVSEFDGGGTLDVVRGEEVRGVVGRPGRPGKLGRVGRVVVRCDVEMLAPGSVVIATVPGVVRSQAVMPAASRIDAPAIKTRVLIWATIGVRASLGP
jgi:hypothetical protein